LGWEKGHEVGIPRELGVYSWEGLFGNGRSAKGWEAFQNLDLDAGFG
jgi:hypothetical protein